MFRLIVYLVSLIHGRYDTKMVPEYRGNLSKENSMTLKNDIIDVATMLEEDKFVI